MDNLYKSIVLDLGANFNPEDEEVLRGIIDDTTNDALMASHRNSKVDRNEQIKILKSNIKKAVKTIYLQRGTEDVSSSNDGGVSNSYVNAIDIMKQDIINEGKRLLS